MKCNLPWLPLYLFRLARHEGVSRVVVDAFEVLGLDRIAGEFVEGGDLAVHLADDVLDEARLVERLLGDVLLVLALQ